MKEDGLRIVLDYYPIPYADRLLFYPMPYAFRWRTNPIPYAVRLFTFVIS